MPLGAKVRLGTKEYELLGFDGDTVTLFNPSSPLFPETLAKDVFVCRLNETPQATDGAKADPARKKAQPPRPARKEKRGEVQPQLDFNAARPKAASSVSVPSEERAETQPPSGPTTPKARLEANMEALRCLHALEEQHRGPTASERRTLAAYAGWGSLSKVFDENDDAWADVRAELKVLLTDIEYREIVFVNLILGHVSV